MAAAQNKSASSASSASPAPGSRGGSGASGGSGAPRSVEGAFRALINTYGLLGRVMGPYFARFGISGAQWGVLRSLHRAELEGINELRQTDLSARLIIRPPSVTNVLDRLQRMGLVTREPCATDARAKLVKLSAAGRELVDRVLLGHGEQISRVLGGLNGAQQEQLRELLNRMSDHLQALVEPEATSRPTDRRNRR